MDPILLKILFLVLLLPGIAGVLIPLIPGVPYMFLVAIVFTFANVITWKSLLFLGILTFFALGVDFAGGIWGAKYGGARKESIIFGFIGLILGFLILPPIGIILGPFVAILVAEYFAHKNKEKAMVAAAGSVFGVLVGKMATMALALVFFFYCAIVVFV